MKFKLFMKMICALVVGFVIAVLLLFLPVGTINYPNAWLFLALLFVPTTGVGIVLLIKDPKLLEKRMNLKEKQKTQKGVVGLSSLILIIGFVMTALDFRYGWSEMTRWQVVEASLLFLFGYGLYIEVLRENKYLSRIVEVQEGQKIIDTGLYSIVRHPMYLATIMIFLSMPLILGSTYALLVFMFYPFLITKRIKNEEEVLEKGLEGYKEYKKKVKFRLIPYIW